MNPDQQEPLVPASAASTPPAWFSASLPNEQIPAKKPNKRRWILITAGALIAVLAIAAVLITILAGNQAKESACLSNNDYYDLTGIQSADTLEASARFFTAEIAFKDTGTDYESSSFGTTVTELLSRVANFYATHSQKSIVIELSADYDNEADYALTASRVQRISDDLVSRGVPDEVVSPGTPLLIQPEDDGGATTTTSSVVISVRSSSTCTAN